MSTKAHRHLELVGVVAGKGAVGDGGGRDQRGGRTRNFILRYWMETGAESAPRLRGTLRDLSGTRSLAFETESGLFALLRRIFAADTDVSDNRLPDKDPSPGGEHNLDEAERPDPEESQ